LPAIYRHCGSDYLGFDIGLIYHGLGLGLVLVLRLGLAIFGLGLGLELGLGLGFAIFGLGLSLELCGLVNITAYGRG